MLCGLCLFKIVYTSKLPRINTVLYCILNCIILSFCLQLIKAFTDHGVPLAPKQSCDNTMTGSLCPATDLPRVCPRTGRHPMRRKKNCVFMGLIVLITFGFLQLITDNEGYSPLRPLPDAESEARRLLKFITHYHIPCNSTFQVGNRSHWPICLDKDVGFDIEGKDNKVLYTVG